MKISELRIKRSCGVVVITSALHAEGPQFDPGRDQKYFNEYVIVLVIIEHCPW